MLGREVNMLGIAVRLYSADIVSLFKESWVTQSNQARFVDENTARTQGFMLLIGAVEKVESRCTLV